MRTDATGAHGDTGRLDWLSRASTLFGAAALELHRDSDRVVNFMRPDESSY